MMKQKDYMLLEEEIIVFPNWFRLHYLLNPGMAFGIEIGGDRLTSLPEA